MVPSLPNLVSLISNSSSLRSVLTLDDSILPRPYALILIASKALTDLLNTLEKNSLGLVKAIFKPPAPLTLSANQAPAPTALEIPVTIRPKGV